MKGLTRNQYSSFICAIVIGFTVLLNYTAYGSCVTPEKTIWAMITPKMENFTDTYTRKQLSSNQSGICRWIILSSEDDSKVKLTFSNFRLKNSSSFYKGDCVEIFDGHDEDSAILDRLCDKVPRKSYISSSSKEMLVIYIRGEVEGTRHFSMTYSSHSGLLTSTLSSQNVTSSPQQQTATVKVRRSSMSQRSSSTTHTSSARPQRSSSKSYNSTQQPQTQVSSKAHTTSAPMFKITSTLRLQISSPHSSSALNTEQIVRIAGIIGAILACAALAYVILKVTKCCKCLRKKETRGSSLASSISRERVRLARGLEQGGGNQEDISQPLSSNNNAIISSTVNHIDEAATDDAHDSDIDSLQGMNEMPPSYESLYLNELGEPATPPKYSPPVHRSSHPPRRVNTFN